MPSDCPPFDLSRKCAPRDRQAPAGFEGAPLDLTTGSFGLNRGSPFGARGRRHVAICSDLSCGGKEPHDHYGEAVPQRKIDNFVGKALVTRPQAEMLIRCA